MIVQYLTDLVGQIPSDVTSGDFVVFVIGCFVLLFLLGELFAFLHNIFRALMGL